METVKEGIAGGIALCSAQLITDLLMKVCACKLGDTGRETPKLTVFFTGIMFIAVVLVHRCLVRGVLSQNLEGV